jgi:hypothetical protein
VDGDGRILLNRCRQLIVNFITGYSLSNNKLHEVALSKNNTNILQCDRSHFVGSATAQKRVVMKYVEQTHG